MAGLFLVQITLLSRDEASMLVVAYADLKRCLDAAVAELRLQGSGVHGHMRRR